MPETIVYLINFITDAVFYLVLAFVILNWLVAFNIINLHNDIVRQIYHAINGLVEPLLRPIRRILPSAGGIDFSPLVLLLGVHFLRVLILRDLLPALT